jgi:hypothetical protein
VEESSQKVFDTSLIFKKQPKVNNHPIGEICPIWSPVTFQKQKSFLCSIEVNITTIHT